jgi:phage terminase large subunit
MSKEYDIDLQHLLFNWRTNPLTFIQQVVGYHLSKKELKQIGTEYGTSPGPIGTRYLMDELQIEILQSMANLTLIKFKESEGIKLAEVERAELTKRGVSTQAGKGCGKTALASLIALWYLICYPQSKVLLVGPKYDQIKKGLYPEIGKWISRSVEVYGKQSILKRLLDVRADEILYKDVDASVLATKNWAIKILTFNSSADEAIQKANIQGLHAENMLFIMDESPGIPDAIFETVINTCTQPNNVIFNIFNPNKNTGWAIEAHADDMKEYWITHQINCQNSSLVTKEAIKYKADKYGVDSNVYRVDVLGIPPLTDDGSFISYQWIQQSIEQYDDYKPHDEDPLVLSLDVGGGTDYSMVVVMHGRKVIEFMKNTSPSTEVVANWFAKKILDYDPDHVYIDSNSLGQGVYDKLRADGFKVKGLKMQMSPSSDKFNRLRDELGYKLREAFQENLIYIPNDEELIAELTLMQEDPEHTTGKFKLLSKKNAGYRKEMRGKLGYESPNKLDALMQCFYKDYTVKLRVKSQNKLNKKMYHSVVQELDKYAWMTG